MALPHAINGHLNSSLFIFGMEGATTQNNETKMVKAEGLSCFCTPSLFKSMLRITVN